MKYGTKMIAESSLAAVPNDKPERDYEIDFTIPEFTCLAPDSGFPDFATIHIRYIPDKKLAGPSSLNPFINKFAARKTFTKPAVNRILEDLGPCPNRRLMKAVGASKSAATIRTW